MIVCHCNRIDHREIESAADKLSGTDELNIVTPVAVYKSLGKVPRCGGCLSLAANLIYTRKLCTSTSSGRCPFIFEKDDVATIRNTPPEEVLLAAELPANFKCLNQYHSDRRRPT